MACCKYLGIPLYVGMGLGAGVIYDSWDLRGERGESNADTVKQTDSTEIGPMSIHFKAHYIARIPA